MATDDGNTNNNSIRDKYTSVFRCKTNFEDEEVNCRCTWRRSKLSGLNVILCNVPSDCVFGTFTFLTKTDSHKPLAACVQRLTWCGSENFPPNFVERVGRTLSNAFAGSTLHADRSVYTVNAESDRGLLALLPPYLDALFLPSMTEHDFREQIYNPRTSKGKPGGEMYKELTTQQSTTGSLQGIECEIYPQDSPYHFPCRGSAEALATVTLAEVREYHRWYYRPSNCFMILAGPIDTEDILEVLYKFETELPPAMLELSRNNPCKIVAPSEPPVLVQPPREGAIERAMQPLLVTRRQESEAPKSVVRFTREVIEVERVKDTIAQAERSGIPEGGKPFFNVHLALQGPDLLRHLEWTAFNFLINLLKSSLNEMQNEGLDDDDPFEGQSFNPSAWSRLTLNTEERKFPLAALTLPGISEEGIEGTAKQFEDLIARFWVKGDSLCLSEPDNLQRLLDAACERYREQLSWRAEFDIVMSLTLWVSSCTADDASADGGSFLAALHPATDFRALREKPNAWWLDFVQTYFTKGVSLIELARVSVGAHELKIDPNKRSSRWTLSSAASDRGFPRDLKEMKECRWETDGTVEAYIESLGGRAALQAS